MPDDALKPVIGIDLGTTFSCIARWDGRGPMTYTLAGGERTLPSVVYYDSKNKDFVVGKFAVSKGRIDPDNAVFGVKRMMDNKNDKIVLGGKEFSPIDISQKILEKLSMDVTNMFPQGVFKPEGFVITVPYYFKAHQCRNTEEAAEKANMNVLGILQEPIAAALAYMIKLEQDRRIQNRTERFLVFDLGGGTFDVTIFELRIDEKKILFEVLATGGDDRLGGLDFDNAIKDYIIKCENLEEDFIIPAKLKGEKLEQKDKEIKQATQKLLEAANTAKESLAFMDKTDIAIPHVFPGKIVDREFSNTEMNQILSPWVDKVNSIVDDTVFEAGIQASDINIVIKVGGSSKLKIMSNLLADKFGAQKIYGDINPSECVGEGAAIYAAILDGRLNLDREIEVQTRTPHSLGVEVENGLFHPIIKANNKAPCEGWEIFSTDKDNVTELDIDVYQGASEKVINCSKVGTVHVKGLKPCEAGELDIKVTFKVSEQQLISVIVEEKESKVYTVEKMQTA